MRTIIWVFIFLINFTFGVQTWAEETGPCRYIEKLRVCLPTPPPVGGSGGECGCTYCNKSGGPGDYKYANTGCADYFPDTFTVEGERIKGSCKTTSCETMTAPCWSIDGGTTITGCPPGDDGKPSQSKCDDVTPPPGFEVCSDNDQSVHDLFCDDVPSETCD
ncbi:MAG: hypothetical protein SGI74_08320 [Oligoflexia bacterium]|nr:hypothetical protein [Oligoflexia bacterium]